MAYTTYSDYARLLTVPGNSEDDDDDGKKTDINVKSKCKKK